MATGAGQLRERIRFERRKTIPDDTYGNVREVWERIGRAFARIEPMRGSETVLAQALEGVGLYRITVRYCSLTAALLTSDRAVNERTGQEYGLMTIENPDEHRAYIRMFAQTNVATG